MSAKATIKWHGPLTPELHWKKCKGEDLTMLSSLLCVGWHYRSNSQDVRRSQLQRKTHSQKSPKSSLVVLVVWDPLLPMQGTGVPFLVGELKSHMPHNVAKKKKSYKSCWYWKVVAELRKMPGFLASGGEEFNLGPVTRLDRSELLCNKALLKYKR